MYTFIVSIILSLAISTFVTLAIRRSLNDMLVEVCGTEKRARFWLVFTNTLLFMAPLLAVMLFGGSGTSTETVLDVGYLRQTISSIIGGLFITLLVVGVQIRGLIPPVFASAPRITSSSENEFWGDKPHQESAQTKHESNSDT